jgi:hypothetical protein
LKYYFTVSVLCLCARVALGGVIAPSSESGNTELDWMDRGEAYRLDTTARSLNSSTDSWVLGLGNNGDVTSQAHFDWGELGNEDALVLGYTQTTSSIDGLTKLLPGTTSSFSDLFTPLKTKSVDSLISNPKTTFTVQNTVVDIKDFVGSGNQGPRNPSSLPFAHVDRFDEPLSDLDLLLEGPLYIDWSGTALTNDEMGMNLKFTQIPEPASIAMVIMVSLTGLIIRRRFR